MHLEQKNIKEAKRTFIKEQIQENKEDPKSLWKVLNRFQSIGESIFCIKGRFRYWQK